jgi:hypothetical protein
MRVFISKEQTKETDEGDKSNSVVYGRCVQRPIKSGARFYRALRATPVHESAIMRSSLVGGITKQSGYFKVFTDCFLLRYSQLPMTKFCNPLKNK